MQSLPPPPLDLMAAYPAFRYPKPPFRVRLTSNVLKLNSWATLLCAILMFVAAALDGSLYFKGIDIGFLEHPTVYGFLLGQWLFPYAVSQALRKFYDIWKGPKPPFRSTFLVTRFQEHSDWLRNSLLRQTNLSRFFYDFAVIIGIIALIWNTYQNQRPELLGFDFWDSVHFPFGFATSRFYKLYLWGFMLPALFHAQLFIFLAISRVLLDAAKGHHLILEPFHPDRCGGARALIDPVIIPMLPPLLITSLLALSAFSVHQKFDVTPLIGVFLLSGVFLTLYLIPAYSLRKAIIIEKDRQLGEIAEKQNGLFFQALRNEKQSSDFVKAVDEPIAS